MAEQEVRIFADEKTRLGWEFLQEVRKIADSLPPEKPRARTVAVEFAPEFKSKGWQAMLFSGSILSEYDNGEVIHRVPNRTCMILDRLGIPYTTLLLKPMKRLL